MNKQSIVYYIFTMENYLAISKNKLLIEKLSVTTASLPHRDQSDSLASTNTLLTSTCLRKWPDIEKTLPPALKCHTLTVCPPTANLGLLNISWTQKNAPCFQILHSVSSVYPIKLTLPFHTFEPLLKWNQKQMGSILQVYD